jgi:hypothetical protein
LFASSDNAKNPYLAELLATARTQKVAESPAWLRLLYYVPTWLGRDVSMVDGKDFFLAPTGRHDPESELTATITGFLAPTTEKHPQCRFPARYTWLKQILKFDEKKLPNEPCPQTNAWLGKISASGVSLVFSNFFLNNPSSMFGHTFLRFHKKTDEKGAKPALLDYALGYAANLWTDNAIFYPLLGVFGGFHGTFSALPYYMKVQEYNNYESRDLWEYELNFTPAQVDLMLKSLWELGTNEIDYYYLDDNCSFIILALLEVGRADLNLTNQFLFWVAPTDTVRAVTDVDQFVRSVHYRPSALSRFRERFSSLTPSERSTMMKIQKSGNGNPEQSLSGMEKSRQAKVLDALIEYIDYDEGLAATPETAQAPPKYHMIRPDILKARSKIQEPASALVVEPNEERPDLGHDSSRFGLGIRRTEPGVNFYSLNWRPALHDISAPAIGYSKFLELHFLDTTFNYLPDSKLWTLADFSLIEILSINPIEPMLPSRSWNLQIGMERPANGFGNQPGEKRFFLRGGIGQSLNFSSTDLLLYYIVLGDLGYETSADFSGQIGLGAKSGISWAITPRTQFTVKLLGLEKLALTNIRQHRWEKKIETGLAYLFTRNVECHLDLVRRQNQNEYAFTLQHYF